MFQHYAYVPLSAAARAALKLGKNTIAVHPHRNRGRQFIDVGLVDVIGKQVPWSAVRGPLRVRFRRDVRRPKPQGRSGE